MYFDIQIRFSSDRVGFNKFGPLEVDEDLLKGLSWTEQADEVMKEIEPYVGAIMYNEQLELKKEKIG